MVNFGQSLRIYLADGVPTGIRSAEIINWTGQAIACPRIRIAELGGWPEVVRPGVYFLLQGGLGIDKGQVYIGESENVRKRLGQQLQEHEFWTEAIAFTNKDDNLTKAHIRYLEARLIALAELAGRYSVVNNTIGTIEPLLPRADKAAMEEFLVNLRVVLSSLGHRLLEPLTPVLNNADEGMQTPVATPPKSPLSLILLSFTTGNVTATGYVTDEGFTLLKDSQVKLDHTPATPKNVIALRAAAKEAGELIQENGLYKLITDKAFSSSSAAIGFVAGNSSSGPAGWKNGAGLTLKQLEQQVLQSSSSMADANADAAEELPIVLESPATAAES